MLGAIASQQVSDDHGTDKSANGSDNLGRLRVRRPRPRPRTSFWMGEIHPLLAPIGSTILMLLITGQEIGGGDTKGVPVPLWLTLNLCGAASALVLAVFEYRHVWSIGYQFRSGPDPLVMDEDQSHSHAEERSDQTSTQTVTRSPGARYPTVDLTPETRGSD